MLINLTSNFSAYHTFSFQVTPHMSHVARSPICGPRRRPDPPPHYVHPRSPSPLSVPLYPTLRPTFMHAAGLRPHPGVRVQKNHGRTSGRIHLQVWAPGDMSLSTSTQSGTGTRINSEIGSSD
jgi:hypothetical protein